MTVVVSIETVTGAHPEPGKSQSVTRPQGKAPVAGWSRAVAATPSSSSVPSAQSFRSSWQSMLASLGNSMNALGEKETQSDEVHTTSESTEAETAVTAATRRSALAGFRGGTAAARIAALVSQPALNNVSKESLESAHPASALDEKDTPRKSARRETSSGDTMPGLAVASVETISLVVPTPGAAIPSVNAIGMEQQTRQAELAATLTTGTAFGLYSRDSRTSDRAGLLARPTNAAADRATGAIGRAGLPANLTPPVSDSATRTAALAGESSPADSAVPSASGFSEPVGKNPGEQGAQASAGMESLPAGGQTAPSGQAFIQGQFQTQLESRGKALGTAVSAVGEDAASQSTAALSGVRKASSAGGLQTAERAVQRMLHGSGTTEHTGQGNHLPGEKSSCPSADASTLVRDSAGTANTSSGKAGSSTGVITGSTVRETFAALDADTGVGTPSWIHAGAQRAEAGFQDPVLGWVGVRADMSGGSVHASLVPGSADAAQALGGHMAGLSSYLAEQHTPVETLTLATPGGTGTESGAGQGMNQEAGQNPGQGGSSKPQSDPQLSSTTVTAAASTEVAAQTGRLSAATRLGGTHISVMA
jgi:hypothetical protein